MMMGKKGIFLKAFFVLMLLSGILTVNGQDKGTQTKKKGFIENKGQIYDQNNAPNPSVKYLATFGNGLNVQLKSVGFSYDSYSVQTKLKEYVHPTDKSLSKTVDELVYQYHRIDVELVGANANAQIIATNPNEGFENYYTPNTSEKGLLSILSYKKVTYIDIYPDIDLEFVISENIEKPIEYNFIVRPGGDLSQIKLKYIGCDSLDIVKNKLQIKTKLGILSETIPASWVKETGVQKSVTYRMIEQQGTNFVIGLSIDVNKQNNETLIIDPIPSIEWGSYYGGSNEDAVLGLSVNLVNDDFYATGFSNSTSNIATSGSVHQIALAGSYDAFLVKFNKDGARLWATYFGGTNEDAGFKVAYDYFGGVSVAGRTKSTSGIASVGAHDQTFVSDDWTRFKAAFLARFNNVDGTRYWATYYGSTDQFIDLRIDEGGPGLAVSPSGIYFASASWEDNSIVAGTTPMQNTFAGMEDMTIAKFGYNGAIIWGTYYGGAADRETATSIALDASENVYVTGFAKSQGLQTTGAYQSLNNGEQDAYVLKMNSAGQKQWFTYYGGSNSESSYGVACDMSNNVYLVGNTYSETNISTIGSHQATKPLNNSIQSGFIAKFTSAGSLSWGTYWGGVSGDGDRINVTTACGLGILVAMIARSSGLASPNASQSAINGNQDVLFARFDTAGVREWATYYGGPELASERMFPYDLKINSKNNIFVCGETASISGISTVNGYDTSFAVGVRDGFITRFSEVAIKGLKTVCEGSTLSLVCEFATSSTTASYSWSGPGGITSTNDTLIVSNAPLSAAGVFTLAITLNGCTYTAASDTIVINPKPDINISSSSAICSGASLSLYANDGDQYQWNGPNGFVSSIQNPVINPISQLDSGLYTVIVTNSFACKDTASINVEIHDNPIPTISSNSPLCAYDSIQLNAGGGVGFSWSGVASYLSTAQNPIIHTTDSTLSGVYAVVVTNQYGCTTSTSTTVEVKSNPKPLLNTNAPVCAGDTLKLFTSSGQSYLWHGPMGYSNVTQNPVLPSALVSQGGWYKQIVSYSNGCLNDDSLLVVVRTNPVITINSDTTICLHQEINVVASGVANYLWNNGITTSSFSIYPSADTTYLVMGVDANGCRDTASFDVHVLPFVQVSLDQSPSGTIFKDQIVSYMATPSGYGNYSFYVNNSLVQNSSANVLTTANIQNGDLVTVVVTHPNVCFSNPELPVKVIEIYNSFSPNDDGVNDLFLKGYQITVFNRWGDVMYQGIDGWDGKFNGEDVNTGTYYFTIKYNTADNQEIEYKGDLMLVR